jgi:hypothetical protein
MSKIWRHIKAHPFSRIAHLLLRIPLKNMEMYGEKKLCVNNALTNVMQALFLSLLITFYVEGFAVF